MFSGRNFLPKMTEGLKKKTSTSEKPPAEVEAAKTVVKTGLPVSKVVVHPLVLLSVVDHFNRVSKTGKIKRVVGVLLGSWKLGKVLDVSNSFAGKKICSTFIKNGKKQNS